MLEDNIQWWWLGGGGVGGRGSDEFVFPSCGNPLLGDQMEDLDRVNVTFDF